MQKAPRSRRSPCTASGGGWPIRNPAVEDSDHALPEQRATDDYQAYELYLRGRYRMHTAATMEDLIVIRGFFEEAARLDSLFIMPVIGLGESYLMSGEADQAEELYERALGSAVRQNKVFEEATVRNSLGTLYRTTGRVDDALKEFEMALELAKLSGDLQTTGMCLQNIGIIFF